MTTTFNPPATADDCHTAIDACLGRMLRPDVIGTQIMLVWLHRSQTLREYGEETWPDEFPKLTDAEIAETIANEDPQ